MCWAYPRCARIEVERRALVVRSADDAEEVRRFMMRGER